MKKKSTTASPLESLNGQLMAMAAHRYCIGSRTYIVGACIEWLNTWWDSFTVNTRRVMVRDTVEALQDKRAGDETDKAGWLAFASARFKQLPEEDRAWIRSAVAHRNKPWPLGEI